ncbi:tyrosine-type recombinase/integrase [Alkalihalobacterium alkalinitrilicum]|uniref:tyrosine-type recombinase/integrase n=1 Tax=Alkalihalobacterium alkalinitrilicum TaxID=427920 RepID=UPI000994DBF3|nr:site-specific integrase [Alkalihalobacterium alkalinitrilicum]
MAKGSIRDRGDGKWQLEVDLGMKLNHLTGKKKRQKKYKTVKAKGKREAEKMLAQFVTEVTADSYFEPEKMMFVDFVEKHWFPKYAKKHLAPRTLDTYLLHINNRILPASQALRIDQVKTIHIVDFLDNLSEPGLRKDGKEDVLSPATIAYHHRILKNIFSRAVEWKIIKENPVVGVKKPKETPKEIEVYDEEEAALLLNRLDKELLHWRVMIKIAITTGLRRSELLGLEWKHIDLEEGIIAVKQGLTYSKSSGFQIGELKTKNSKRTVTIPSSLIPELKKLKTKKQQERIAAEELWNGGDYFFLFSDFKGIPFHPTSVTTWWRRFINRHKLKYINFHALRHTSATLLINQGIHAKTISSRLGHADIKTTMNTYGHVLEKADREAANSLDTLFKKG